MTVELLYYRKRVAEEAAAAAAAETPIVRQIHLELARCYEQRVEALDDAPGEFQIHLMSVAS